MTNSTAMLAARRGILTESWPSTLAQGNRAPDVVPRFAQCHSWGGTRTFARTASGASAAEGSADRQWHAVSRWGTELSIASGAREAQTGSGYLWPRYL